MELEREQSPGVGGGEPGPLLLDGKKKKKPSQMFLKIHITNLNGMSWLIYSDTELLTGEKADTGSLLEKSWEFHNETKWLTVQRAPQP